MIEPPLPLRTERLVLRPYRPDDAAYLLAVYSRPDVVRHLLEEPWSERDVADKLEQRRRRTGLTTPSRALALIVEHDGSPVGDLALWSAEDEPRKAEIGWVLDPAAGGRGFATEAVRRLLDVALDVDGYALHRVSAQMDARNAASARLAGKVGMRREAHLRQDWWSKGEWTDTLVFGLLAEDR